MKNAASSLVLSSAKSSADIYRMDDLKSWLQDGGKAYDAGVKLFLKYGKDKNLHALFTQEQETEYKRIRLQQCVKALYDEYTRPGSKVAIVQKQIEQAPVAHKGWPKDNTDPVIQTLNDQWKPLYSELMSAQQRIYEIALQGENSNSHKKLEACQLAHRILDLDDQLDDIYFNRDYYLANGRLPDSDKEDPIVGDPVRLADERKNIERYIREHKQLLREDPTHRLAAKRQQKLQDYEKKLAHYRKLLKLDP